MAMRLADWKSSIAVVVNLRHRADGRARLLRETVFCSMEMAARGRQPNQRQLLQLIKN